MLQMASMPIDVESNVIQAAGAGFPDVVDFYSPVADRAFAVKGVAEQGAGKILVAIELVVGA